MLSRLRQLVHHLNHSKALSTTAATGGSGVRVVNSNPACCSIPPVQSDYTPKGEYKEYAGFKRVSKTSDIAIVSVFDIFGFFPQTQQGADILAESMNATVYMPDFFEPDKPFPLEKFPPKTDKEKDELQEFFDGPAKPEKAVGNLKRVGQTLRDDGAKWVGAYGMCWGGKVTILGGSYDKPVFDAVAALHPAMLSAKDADDLSVPLGLFISKDEPKKEFDEMVEKLTHKPFADKVMYKYYPTMFHGWAAARADLKDPENKKQFDDVYEKLQEFFSGAIARDRGGTRTQI